METGDKTIKVPVLSKKNGVWKLFGVFPLKKP